MVPASTKLRRPHRNLPILFFVSPFSPRGTQRTTAIMPQLLSAVHRTDQLWEALNKRQEMARWAVQTKGASIRQACSDLLGQSDLLSLYHYQPM